MIDFLEILNLWMQPMFGATWFNLVLSLVIYANPVAILPQLIAALREPNIDSIAPSTWWVFAAIQMALALNGIQTQSVSVFMSMVISLGMSITIIVTVTIRRRRQRVRAVRFPDDTP